MSVILVLGGARSGKSAVAEERVAGLDASVTVLATAVVDPADADFVARVAVHRARRPAHWQTVECGAELAPALRATSGAVLVDSLGTWAAAHSGFEVDVAPVVSALRDRKGDTVVVSDEVGLGVHPSSEAGLRFRDALGDVNTAVAAAADVVLLVVAGRVLEL